MSRGFRPTPVSRRALLGGLLASGGLALSRPVFASNPDVVIIGAGTAGLAAARRLDARGLTWVMLEASGRIGGRAFTEETSLGVPFDQGASWIHQSNRNPLTAVAAEAGFTTFNDDDVGGSFYVGDRLATAAEDRQADVAWDGLIGAMSEAGRRRQDVSAASVSPRDLPWIQVSETWVGPMSMGRDLENISCVDWWNMADTAPNLIVKEGYGALVAHYGEGLPVSLNTKATQVRWGGPGVEVETDKGTISAKAAIITVSTGVLNAGSLRFDPPLPDWKQEAIAGMPMGLLAKIGLRLSPGDRYGLRPNGWLSYKVETREACYFVTWPWDQDTMIGFVGGKFAWDLTKAGSKAAIDFAVGELQKTLGAEATKRVIASVWTDWGANPLTLGAYASALPGQATARNKLALPVGERLYFAGEACAVALAQTVGGAYVTGQKAADAIASVT
ncbi:MAG: FAD-dependent oxidoreductase [Pseudomonadota bacterium]